jgi:hypothetical protein
VGEGGPGNPGKRHFTVETEGLSVNGLTATDESKQKGRNLLGVHVKGARYVREIFTSKCPYHLLTGRDFITHTQATNVFSCVVY